MHRRTFLTTSGATATAVVGGCLGDTDHGQEFQSEIERRGVEVNEILLEESVVTVEYVSEEMQQDLAEVAMAFVERIDDGWTVDRLDGVGRGEPDATWHAEAGWARKYLDGTIDADEYGDQIGDTIQMAIIVDDGEANRGENQTED